MNHKDCCKLLVLIPLAPLIGCLIIIFGVVFPIVLIGIFLAYIIITEIKQL